MIKRLSEKVNFEIVGFILAFTALAFLFALNLPNMVDSWVDREYRVPMENKTVYVNDFEE